MTLRGVDLARLIKAHKNKGEITRLLSIKHISRNLAEKIYQNIKKAMPGNTIADNWTSFEKSVEEAFNKKVKMTIFSYDKGMERDTMMSPLDSLKYHRMQLQTGIVAMNPTNGHVKVWVGGVNHKYFKYDHVRADRQVWFLLSSHLFIRRLYFLKGFHRVLRLKMYHIP